MTLTIVSTTVLYCDVRTPDSSTALNNVFYRNKLVFTTTALSLYYVQK